MDPQVFGKATKVTASGYTAITSANAAIIGILFHGSGTGIVSLYADSSGSVTISGLLRGYATMAGVTAPQAFFLSYPAYCSGGFTVNVAATDDPSVTLFWNPLSGA